MRSGTTVLRDFNGKGAFVTGGASGFGYALAETMLHEGMRVVIADLDAAQVDKARQSLRRLGDVESIVCNVSSFDQVMEAANAAVEFAGKIHVVCNNAGVLTPGPLAEADTRDWLWTLNVNVIGVVHGVRAFLPHFRSHGEPAHFVNTASMAGLLGFANASAYCASKAAVISISESLAAETAEDSIGVTVLCPGFMRTKLHESSLARPGQFGGRKAHLVNSPTMDSAELPAAIEAGMEPNQVASRVLAAIREGDFYVVTHPHHKDEILDKASDLQAAYERIRDR